MLLRVGIFHSDILKNFKFYLNVRECCKIDQIKGGCSVFSCSFSLLQTHYIKVNVGLFLNCLVNNSFLLSMTHFGGGWMEGCRTGFGLLRGDWFFGFVLHEVNREKRTQRKEYKLKNNLDEQSDRNNHCSR